MAKQMQIFDNGSFLRLMICFTVSFSTSASLNSQVLSNPVLALKEKREFIYGIDNRRTHIKEQSTIIYGIYVGIGFGGKLRLKSGISGVPFEKGEFLDEQGLVKKNKLIFFNLGEEFDFFIHHKFRLTAYVQSGIGFNFFRKLDKFNVEIEKGNYLIIPIELGVHANYDIVPWLRTKVGGGWRLVAPYDANDLSGYYLKLGIGVDADLLIEMFKNRNIHATSMN